LATWALILSTRREVSRGHAGQRHFSPLVPWSPVISVEVVPNEAGGDREVVVDLDREQHIEELRRIAHTQQAQMRILLDAIAKQNKELAAFKGTKGDAQLTLKMLEVLQAKAKAAEEETRAQTTIVVRPDRAASATDHRERILWDLAYAVSKRLAIVDEARAKHVLAQPVIGLDQTGWPRLETDATKPSQMWAHRARRRRASNPRR
jgi:hypothetical protein